MKAKSNGLALRCTVLYVCRSKKKEVNATYAYVVTNFVNLFVRGDEQKIEER